MNVVTAAEGNEPRIVVGRGCEIGRRATISCRNQIVLEADVLLAPSVLIMDHNHEFSDVYRPIHAQGETPGGTIVIERNCWLGHCATILSNHGELRLGRNSVVGAGAVVTRSFPPFSIVGGNPARLLKTFDQQSGQWIKPRE
jgi:acetyltransferase-like isoleucine patch superfamily enzyme